MFVCDVCGTRAHADAIVAGFCPNVAEHPSAINFPVKQTYPNWAAYPSPQFVAQWLDECAHEITTRNYGLSRGSPAFTAAFNAIKALHDEATGVSPSFYQP